MGIWAQDNGILFLSALPTLHYIFQNDKSFIYLPLTRNSFGQFIFNLKKKAPIRILIYKPSQIDVDNMYVI